MTVPGDVTTVATTYGAILLGTCLGCALTGLVFVQCVLYYKLYPGDYAWTKFLVFLVWALDLTHTILIVVTAWQSVITGFNKPEDMDLIPPALGAVTAAVTFLVHWSVAACISGDGAHGIPPASSLTEFGNKWYIAVPVVILAFCRLLAACCSTSEIIHLKHYSLFIRPYPAWIFTVGVTLSASVEIIITTTMIIFLGSRKTGFANMNHIINSLILYTLETGSVTSIVTVASLICWLIMRHNLIFLGMHFAIAKRVFSVFSLVGNLFLPITVYANSLLATLNTRKRLRVDRMYSSERDQTGGLAAGLPYSGVNKSHVSQRILGPTTTQKSMQLNVNVETTVVSKIDEGFNDFDHDIEDQRDSLTEFEKDEHKLGELRGSSEKEPNVHFP
ncbi:hypothetical protein F5J12DRAFT_897432 [Pisolithus orientalis]|uniref:uncharacterized protein n=1 Tax=Pisolithus orientalis TaxID=936130 RepID=UPI0022243F63|nr:uncharacterized protein F5J12DRAFT_897432 [Pisolithus orientalis]KAI5991741.1 hypothetical protein F5J12DRAFT_897432 [Pisolithus orientalis]